MGQWDGKSKGTVLGYKIFVFFIKKVGIKSAYLVLYFVASYYFIFLKKSNTSIFYYFRKRLGYSFIKSKQMVFKSYYTFGQTIIDKIAIVIVDGEIGTKCCNRSIHSAVDRNNTSVVIKLILGKPI